MSLIEVQSKRLTSKRIADESGRVISEATSQVIIENSDYPKSTLCDRQKTYRSVSATVNKHGSSSSSSHSPS